MTQDVENNDRRITLWDIANMITGVNEVLSDMMDLYELQGKRMTLITQYVDDTRKTLKAGKRRKKHDK